MSDSSIIFAMKMVQVTSEAKASPIITALTRISADRNIDQGDSSRSATVVDFSDLAPSVGVAVASAAAGVGLDGTTADGAGACIGGPACAGVAGTCESAGACCGAGSAFCCADDGAASDSIASAKIKPEIARKGDIFIFRPGVNRSIVTHASGQLQLLPDGGMKTRRCRIGRERAVACRRCQEKGGARG